MDGQNHFLRACSDVFTRSFVGQEDTGCFSNNINTYVAPFQVSRIFLSGNANGFAVYDQMTIFNVNGTVETAVSGVILQHVSHVFCIQQIVDCHDLDVRTLLSSTENDATDTAKTVDTYFDSHIFHQLFVSE